MENKNDNNKQYAAFILNDIAKEYESIASELSQTELEQSIYYLNTSFGILQNSKQWFPSEIIASVRDCINALNHERFIRNYY